MEGSSAAEITPRVTRTGETWGRENKYFFHGCPTPEWVGDALYNMYCRTNSQVVVFSMKLYEGSALSIE